jgi:hypothetical protein
MIKQSGAVKRMDFWIAAPFAMLAMTAAGNDK